MLFLKINNNLYFKFYNFYMIQSWNHFFIFQYTKAQYWTRLNIFFSRKRNNRGKIFLGLHETGSFIFFRQPFVLIMKKVLALAHFYCNLPYSRFSHNFFEVVACSLHCSFVANSFISPSPLRRSFSSYFLRQWMNI